MMSSSVAVSEYSADHSNSGQLNNHSQTNGSVQSVQASDNNSYSYYHYDLYGNYDHYNEMETKYLDIVLTYYLPPILIVLGSVGNILTLVVMRRKTFSPYSISFYVSAYCVANLLTLYMFLGSQWIADVAQTKAIDEQTDWLCRLWQFIIRVISFSGIWFVVAMTIDKYIVIWHPWRASSMCTVFMAKFVAVTIIVGLVVVSIHAMWTYELMNGCYAYHKDNDIHAQMWPWMSASFYSFIPLSLLFIFDLMILTGLCLKRPLKHSHAHATSHHILTHMTLGLSMLYFFLVLPPTIINIMDKTYPPKWLQDRDIMSQLHRARFAGHFMAWVNTVIVFYVCLVFSRKFRNEFMDMFKSVLCFRHQSRIYELQAGSQSSATQVEMDACTETTPL